MQYSPRRPIDSMIQIHYLIILHIKIAMSMVSNAITNAPMNASITPLNR